MNIVLDKTTTRKSKANKLQARFERLQQRLSAEQRRTEKFKSELDAVVQAYQEQMLRAERQAAEPLRALGEKLITFFGRKTLAQWQRAELGDWIMETIRRVGRVDPAAADALHERFRQSLAAQLGMSEEELAAVAQEALAEEQETPSGSAGDEFRWDDIQADLFGFGDQPGQDPDEEDYEGIRGEGPFDPEEEFADGEHARDARLRRLMDGSWVRSLFQLTARALHPDKEQDEGQRERKQRLMQRLLDARKHGDILTLLQLHAEHAASGDIVLAEQEMAAACELMDHQIEALRAEREEHAWSDPLRSMIYERIYDRSKQVRERKLRELERQLRREAEQTEGLVAELRNLTVLKAALAERSESRAMEAIELVLGPDWP